jgi:hypothetical protein
MDNLVEGGLTFVCVRAFPNEAGNFFYLSPFHFEFK